MWSPRREACALPVNIVLTDSLKGGSSLSELPGLAVLGGGCGSGGGCGIRELPRYLCVKGHTGLAEEAKATACLFSTQTVARLSRPGCLRTLVHSQHIVHSYLCACGLHDERCIVKNGGKPPHMFSFL